MTARIIFMGTPDFAVPSLEALLDSDYQVVAVVTQPDRPRGRGKKVTPPPVKVTAQQAGVPVLQPETLRTAEAVAELTALAPDLIVVAAFGQILRPDVLNLPRHGCINVHASLLPRWRGAAPVAAAIRAGDAETGVSLMVMEEGLDTGPVIARRAIPISATHTRATLTADLAALGAQLLTDTLPAWLAGQIQAETQDDRLATKASLLKKEEGAVNWQHAAARIDRHIRAFDPWPGAFTEGPRGRIKLLQAGPAADVSAPPQAGPGFVFKQGKGVYVVTGDGVLKLETVQPAGKKAMPALAMLNGQPELTQFSRSQ